MYAVIATGGKQYRVAEGERLDVERLGTGEGEVTFAPLLVVDGDSVLTGPGGLAGASVTARVVGESAGPKIRGFTYKSKTNNRRHWGHRQHYATIEITGITAGSQG
ncbi:MAG: 50S ribosomal protein L21 [Acidimicrobiales bacterium]